MADTVRVCVVGLCALASSFVQLAVSIIFDLFVLSWASQAQWHARHPLILKTNVQLLTYWQLLR